MMKEADAAPRTLVEVRLCGEEEEQLPQRTATKLLAARKGHLKYYFLIGSAKCSCLKKEGEVVLFVSIMREGSRVG